MVPSDASVATSAISFIETEHGRLRRKQRGIDKKDLQAARKYGTRRPGRTRRNGDTTSMYQYKDITYIMNDVTGEEITSYAASIPLDPIPWTPERKLEERQARSLRESHPPDDTSWWLSNTVLVVDTSGSMGKSDVWGCRTRLQAAWFALALDFLAQRIESGSAGPKDIVSIVTLCEFPTVILRERQCTWELYNDLVRIYSSGLVPHRGHGPYLPCFQIVKQLLDRSADSGGALCVGFLSDGVPSDGSMRSSWFDPASMNLQERIAEEVGELAKNYGRRLSFISIGIGHPDDFSTLHKMVEAAKDYGARGFFQLPSMTASGLGLAFSSIASSLTSTQSEMTDLDTLKQQKVRQVTQESRKKAVHVCTTQSVAQGLHGAL
jgi:hypothetical protein